MLIKEQHNNKADIHTYIFDNQQEALSKAREIEKEKGESQVVFSDGKYYAEFPADSFLRTGEEIIYSSLK